MAKMDLAHYEIIVHSKFSLKLNLIEFGVHYSDLNLIPPPVKL